MERETKAVEPLRLTDVLSRSDAIPRLLAAGEVAVWRLHCPPSLPLPAAAVGLLDDAERSRAARFLRETDRRLFTFSHAMLRRILAAFAGLAPQAVTYARTPEGKPYLAGGPQFNLSHAGDCAVVAICTDTPVGVDVEAVRELPDADGLVGRFFAAEERVAYQSCPPADRAKAFFTLWTRKEAYSKALGGGLSIPFNDFAVSLDAPARLLRPWPGAAGPAPQLWDLAMPAGYAGALAATAERVLCRDFLI